MTHSQPYSTDLAHHLLIDEKFKSRLKHIMEFYPNVYSHHQIQSMMVKNEDDDMIRALDFYEKWGIAVCEEITAGITKELTVRDMPRHDYIIESFVVKGYLDENGNQTMLFPQDALSAEYELTDYQKGVIEARRKK